MAVGHALTCTNFRRHQAVRSAGRSLQEENPHAPPPASTARASGTAGYSSPPAADARRCAVTSAEAEIAVEHPAESDNAEPGPSAPVTPWSNRQRRTKPAAPGQPVTPGQNGSTPASQGYNATPPGKAAQGANSGAPPAGSGTGQSVPAGTVTPPAGATQAPSAGTAQPAPAGQSAPNQAHTAPAEPDPLVDPDTVAALAPAALSAGAMALGVLPMLASALAGLGSGGGGGGSGANGTGTGTGTGTGADGGADGSEGGLSPEAQKALQALKLLAAVYGDGKTGDPQVKQLRQQLGIKGSGSGATAIKARQLFQRNAATAFNNLDNQLGSYITGLAGDHKVDKKAVTALIREVNVALAELGPQAYTKAGREKVHQILTTALQKASQIVTGSNASASDTANAINRLTNQYLYNIAGKKYAAATPGGTSSAAQKAIQVALAHQGNPYVWGAEGPNSFDCSGLMQYAAAQAGVSIPRVAADQYQKLPKVNPGDIRPGDLIFPQAQFNGGSPGHVMMYIGNGQCVEAPRTGDVVKVVNLPSSFHASRWS